MYYNKAFLQFRFLQAGKIVREIPVPYLLMLVIMCVFLVCGLYTFMDSQSRAAIRKQGIWLLFFYGGAYLGALFPYVSLALLWLFTGMLAECFVYAEPTAMLCMQELPASRFLHRKLSLYVRLYTLAIAPVCLLYSLLHPSQWWLVLLFAISGILNVALMVVSKYAAYLPNTRIQAGQIAISLSLFGILLPALAPLTLLLLIKKYRAARHHLTSYLYAYN